MRVGLPYLTQYSTTGKAPYPRKMLTSHKEPLKLQLLPEKLAKRIPVLGSNQSILLEDKTAFAKFLCPDLSWRWYIIEYDGENTFFGIIMAGEQAIAGEFTLSELESLEFSGINNDKSGVEFDKHFQPTTLRELVKTEPSIRQMLQKSGLDLVDLDL